MSRVDPDRTVIPFKTSGSITLSHNCSIESIICQLQPLTHKFLYVLNGTTINYYDTLDEVPPGNRRLETDLTKPSNEYYIRDLSTFTLICCFDLRLCDRLLHGKAREKKSAPIPISGTWTSLSDDQRPFFNRSTEASPVSPVSSTPGTTPSSAPLISSLEHRHLKPISKPSLPDSRQLSRTTHLEQKDIPKKTIDISTNVEKATSITTLEYL